VLTMETPGAVLDQLLEAAAIQRELLHLLCVDQRTESCIGGVNLSNFALDGDGLICCPTGSEKSDDALRANGQRYAPMNHVEKPPFDASTHSCRSEVRHIEAPGGVLIAVASIRFRHS